MKPTKRVKKSKPMTVAERKTKGSQLRTLLAAGFEKDQIIMLMDLSQSQWDYLHRDVMMQAEGDLAALSTQRAYLGYIITQKYLMQNLEDLKTSFKPSPSGQNRIAKEAQIYLGSIKAQSDIAQRILNTGVDLGILAKTTGKLLEIDGTDPRDMSEDELAQALEKELEGARKLTKGRSGKRKSGGKDPREEGAKIFVIRPDAKTSG